MTKAKPRIVYRTRTVYRDRPEDEQTTTATASVITTQKVNGWIGSITIADMKQWLQVMVPLAVFWWAYLGPLVETKAEELLAGKLAQMGVDPSNIKTLNESIAKLQDQTDSKEQAVEKLSGEVNDLKVGLGQVLILLQQQSQNPPSAEPAK
jgi:hypothetical protein